MPSIPKILETATEYKSIVKFLQAKIISEDLQQNHIAKSNFIHRCKKFELDKDEFLYTRAIIKDEVIKPTIEAITRHFLPFQSTISELLKKKFKLT
ncbi:5941_t:CDS:2, partial [Acaulospora morrowiae]